MKTIKGKLFQEELARLQKLFSSPENYLGIGKLFQEELAHLE